MERSPRASGKTSEVSAVRTILFVAGEPSGDLHAAGLIAAIKRLDPALSAAAVGGGRMKSAADEFLEDLASRGITGFLEPVKALPFFARLALKLRGFMRERKPEAVVCVDYYGFNRRVLEIAKKCGVRAYYYISPQIWATRPGRILALKKLVRRMFVIFPFEEEIYKAAGVPCTFVGHPLLDVLPPSDPREREGAALKVGLLPGSRPGEIKRHLPIFIKSFQLMRRQFLAARALVFASSQLPDSLYQSGRVPGVQIVRESDYRERAALDIALTSSGTATLENALLGIPMVVAYRLSWPSYAVARALIKVRHIAMANILAGKTLVPELIQGQATPENIAGEAARMLENPSRLAALKRELAGLRENLGTPGASLRAAREILSDLK